MKCSLAAATALIITTLASSALAKRGTIRGRLIDQSNSPIRYGNVMVGGTYLGAMTDDDGRYSTEVPVGEIRVRVLAWGFKQKAETVRLGAGDVVEMNFTLQEQVLEIPAVWPNRDPDPLVPLITEDQVRPINVWDYPATSDPIEHDGTEFRLRYVLAEEGDSVVVNVIAEGRNVSDEPIDMCGCFAFWKVQYGWSPEVVAEHTRFGPADRSTIFPFYPWLDIPVEDCRGATLECEPQRIAPGESIAQGMAFFFYPRAFAYWNGEVEVRCFFFGGKDGTRWRDVDRVDLGTIKIPIRPIGQPLREEQR